MRAQRIIQEIVIMSNERTFQKPEGEETKAKLLLRVVNCSFKNEMAKANNAAALTNAYSDSEE